MNTQTYRTLLRQLLHLPDPQIQTYYRSRYRKLCGDAVSARTKACQCDIADQQKWIKREKRYRGELQKEIRRLHAVSAVLCTGSTTNRTETTNGRKVRQERKEGFRAFERMVSLTYARAGKRRWEVLDIIYPRSARLPLPGSKGPPPLPEHLTSLKKTVKMTAQATRDRSLRERYATDEYRAWISRKKEWTIRTKFLRGVAVPMKLPSDVGGEREQWEGMKRFAEGMRDGIAYRGSIRTIVAGKCPEPTTGLPRPLRRIYERLLAGVPVLDGSAPPRWMPPPASEEDLKWIVQ